MEEKSDYDLFWSEAELASEKFDSNIPICPPPDDMKVYIPVTWGQEKSLDVWTIFDPAMMISCCDYNLWEGLEGEVEIGKTSMMGIGGKSFNLTKFKWVYRYTLTYQARIKIWRNVMLGGNQIVLNRDDAKELGVSVEGVHSVFPSRKISSSRDDHVWCEEEEVSVDETQWEKEKVDILLQSVESALDVNAKLPTSSFCNLINSYDYVNRDALLHILKGLNAPPQAIYVVEKVLRESVTWLPNIGGSKRGGNNESIQSRTGVRQGCPISPLLFVIVFDILLVSLKKEYNPQDLSGFMDDLGMVIQKAETINSLTPTFKKYEEATGAKLNFNKCFVLSTESFKPVGPWAEMARSNYCGDETVYLGVRLSKRLSPLKDWEKVILKMKKVGAAIKKRGGNFRSRVRMVNTYLTPCMGYLARFKLIPKSVASLMWKSIRSALGAYANTKTSILTSCYPPLDSNHPTAPSNCF